MKFHLSNGLDIYRNEPASPIKPTPFGLTVAVTKEPEQTADSTGKITISGSKSHRTGIMNYAFEQEGRETVEKTCEITIDMTAIQLATAVVAAHSDADVLITRSGGALTFSPKAGSYLNLLTSSIEG